jgi:outer membrane protein OmpA-like peptidoglycan-associated protein
MTCWKEHLMKMTGSLIIVACAALVMSGCAATVPGELTDARLAYAHANAGPAAQLAPVELHNAREALTQAENAFSKDAKSYHTLDLAYVAQRKAETADAQASIAMEQKSKARSDGEFQATQGSILQQKTEDLSQTRTALAISEQSGQATAQQLSAEQSARLEAEKRTTEQRMLAQATTQDLNQTRTALAVSERGEQATAEQLSAEQNARVAAEQKTADALAALAKLAAVKEEERGLVITLSGSVLFRSDEATLMPGAQSRLDQVADALLATRGRNVLVEGFTDDQGTDQYNLDLSQRRAEAVRNYLVQRGYDPTRIQSRGVGEGSPVADNATAEGRANNRRVEIILEREARP